MVGDVVSGFYFNFLCPLGLPHHIPTPCTRSNKPWDSTSNLMSLPLHSLSCDVVPYNLPLARKATLSTSIIDRHLHFSPYLQTVTWFVNGCRLGAPGANLARSCVLSRSAMTMQLAFIISEDVPAPRNSQMSNVVSSHLGRRVFNILR